jgi:hypothetical protein
VLGRALAAKGRAVVRFLQTLQDLPGNTQRRLGRMNVAHGEALLGIEGR